MRLKIISFSLIVLFSCRQNESWKYLGQTPPKAGPEIFAPGIISMENSQQIFVSFSSDMKEIYFDKRWDFSNGRFGNEALMYVKYENNTWSNPKILLPKAGSCPTFSPDGSRLYINDNYLEKTEHGWSTEFNKIGDPLTGWGVVRSSISSKGTMFFENRFRGEYKKGQHGIYFTKIVDGKYEEPKFLIDGNHPFVSQDESYLIFDRDSNENDGYGAGDLYVIFQKSDGKWTKEINLGETINSSNEDIYASVSPDGKYIFFQSVRLEGYQKDGSISWADASIITKLKKAVK